MFSRLFHQYSWNSEVETTWKSWICWRHRTSNTFGLSSSQTFTLQESRQHVLSANILLFQYILCDCNVRHCPWPGYVCGQLHNENALFFLVSIVQFYLTFRANSRCIYWTLRCSTCPLVFGCWELSHIIFLMLRKKELLVDIGKFTKGCFIYIRDSSNSSLTTFWTTL